MYEAQFIAAFILSERYMYIHVWQGKKEEKSWWCHFCISPNMRQPEDLTNSHFASCAMRPISDSLKNHSISTTSPNGPAEVSGPPKDATESLCMRSCFKYGELMGLLENNDTDTVFTRHFSYRQGTCFWQNSSAWVASPYFKDVILNITDRLQSWEVPLSAQEHDSSSH